MRARESYELTLLTYTHFLWVWLLTFTQLQVYLVEQEARMAELGRRGVEGLGDSFSSVSPLKRSVSSDQQSAELSKMVTQGMRSRDQIRDRRSGRKGGDVEERDILQQQQVQEGSGPLVRSNSNQDLAQTVATSRQLPSGIDRAAPGEAAPPGPSSRAGSAAASTSSKQQKSRSRLPWVALYQVIKRARESARTQRGRRD